MSQENRPSAGDNRLNRGCIKIDCSYPLCTVSHQESEKKDPHIKSPKDVLRNQDKTPWSEGKDGRYADEVTCTVNHNGEAVGFLDQSKISRECIV